MQPLVLVLINFNSKIGRDRCGEFVGPFGLGEINERGERLNIFCNENNLVAMELMEERRKSRNNPGEYRQIDKKIRKEIRTAKEDWLKNQCQEIKTLGKKHDHFNLPI